MIATTGAYVGESVVCFPHHHSHSRLYILVPVNRVHFGVIAEGVALVWHCNHAMPYCRVVMEWQYGVVGVMVSIR
ncbi:hypothetical protein E2C01_091957 [Portunus trituberculatus]|uniref:Uncharacterized protein n=1 Tax=Portunus trituberculatus TaxID=210409 RepID=A0A5B7JKD8_PORTR|nr:hypothetical protein [Portunus trituberculatus]